MRRWLVGGGAALVVVFALVAGAAILGRAERLNKAGIDMSDKGDCRGAIGLFAKAAAADPAMAKAHFNMGLCYIRLRQADQAAACFRKALDVDPGYVKASEMLTRVNTAIDFRRQP